MKNSFSKTLICGVIASSFILINCQKAASGRGVKGIRSGTDDSKVTSTATSTEKAADEVAKPNEATEVFLIKCSPEFMSQYGTWIKTIESKDVSNIRSLKKEDVVETQKQDLIQLAKRIDSETKSVRSEFDKLQASQDKADENKSIKKNLDGCFIGEGKDRTEYLILKIEENANNIAFRIAELTGEETPSALAGKNEAKQREEKSLNESDVTKNARYYISDELNQAFDDAKVDESFFMDGKVLSGESNLNKAKADESSSVCFTSDTSGKIEDLKTTLNALSTEANEKAAGKTTHKIRFANEGRFYTLSCVIPTAKKLADGFSLAMGDLLQTKNQLHKKQKVALEEKNEVNKVEKVDQAKQVEKLKTAKKSIIQTAGKIKKIKLTAKQKQEFFDEDTKASVEKNTEAKENSQDELLVEKEYIPSHLISNSHK